MPESSLDNALALIYGFSSAILADQRERYTTALSTFRALYGAGDVAILHAPGRLNLIGEHTDYNHGYVMPVALDKDILLVCRPRRDALVNLANLEPEFTPRRFRLAREIPVAPVGDWANYAQGAGQWLQQTNISPLVGFDALVEGSAPLGIPRGAGLSSSSALTVAMMAALVECNRVNLQSDALAAGCAQAEWYVGTRGGIMDHFCSVLGQRDKALFLDCRPTSDNHYHYEHVPLPVGYSLMIVESGLAHRNTGPHFNRRVAEGRIGVSLLQTHYPSITHLRDVGDIPWSTLEPLLPETISSRELLARGIDPEQVLDNGLSPQTDTFLVRRRCRHVISENQRELDCVAALKHGEMEQVGRLLHAAHTSASLDYDISTPEIDTLVTLAEAQPGCLGARLTGAGWGGCILALV
ncbi:MAG: galactokinase, partial [Chloroflexi bacterium]|nr:galactokinase [Chloroflexota bacterium]